MTVRQMPHDVGPEHQRQPPQTIGMSLDEERHVCYLVGEKKIEDGGIKKDAVGTAIITGKIGSFVVAKELGMTLKDS
jgi:hypothetical protein